MVCGLKQGIPIMDNHDYNPYTGTKITALTTISVALVATGTLAGYVLVAVIVGYIFLL